MPLFKDQLIFGDVERLGVVVEREKFSVFALFHRRRETLILEELNVQLGFDAQRRSSSTIGPTRG